MKSITIYSVENGFIVSKNEESKSLFTFGAVIFEHVGNEYGSDLASFIREWHGEGINLETTEVKPED